MRFQWPIVNPVPRPYLGLGWWRIAGRPARFMDERLRTWNGVLGVSLPSAPWGWRWLKEPDRNAAVCLPLWLYWPIVGWLCRWDVMRALEWLGIWRVREEGGYLWDGDWLLPDWLRAPIWCFLHDRDHYTDRLEYVVGVGRRRPSEPMAPGDFWRMVNGTMRDVMQSSSIGRRARWSVR